MKLIHNVDTGPVIKIGVLQDLTCINKNQDKTQENILLGHRFKMLCVCMSYIFLT